MTSVGSGSLIIIALLLVYPRLQASQLVGTDLVQAVPLVASAAVGHLLFGNFQLAVTTSLLVGSIPGVPARGPGRPARPPAASYDARSRSCCWRPGSSCWGAGNGVMVAAVLAFAVLGPIAWMGARRSQGLPALARSRRRTLAPTGS